MKELNEYAELLWTQVINVKSMSVRKQGKKYGKKSGKGLLKFNYKLPVLCKYGLE